MICLFMCNSITLKKKTFKMGANVKCVLITEVKK